MRKKLYVAFVFCILLIISHSTVKAVAPSGDGNKRGTGEEEPSGRDMVGIESDIQNENTQFDSQMDYACQAIEKDKEDIANVEILKDIDDEDSFLLIDFYSGGYVILLNGYNYICESAEAGESPYKGVTQPQYYIGGLQYFYEQEGELKSVNSGKTISEDERKVAHYIKEEVLKNATDKVNIPDSKSTAEFPGSLLPSKEYIENCIWMIIRIIHAA